MESIKALETQAWECDEWPAWLHSVIDRANDVADRLDMSSEQAMAYAVLIALSAQGEAAQPAAEGWVLVPREPTPAMIEKGLAATGAWLDIPGSKLTVNREKMRRRYCAMVAASPNAASQDGGRDGTLPPGTVRICPMRDAACPHGLNCQYVGDGPYGYPCKEGWRS